MSWKLKYETLFELKILHHFYLDNGKELYDNLSDMEKFRIQNKYRIQDFLSIAPVAQTMKFLSGNQILCKATDQGLITGVVRHKNEAGETKPLFAPNDPLVLSFRISIRDGLFNNYTSLPLKPNPGYVYYFTNESRFQKRIFPAITALNSVFKGGTSYYPGDMLVNNAANPTKLYIAQKKNKVNPSSAPEGNWKEDSLVDGKPLSYAGSNDLIRRSGHLFVYEITKDTDDVPVLEIEDRNGNPLTLKTVIETGEFNKVKTDLSLFPEGLYKATVTTDDGYSDEFLFYHTTDASAWAFVDICVKTADTSYDLLTSNGGLKSPVFTLRFKNRYTFWRYIGANFGAESVSDTMLPLTRQGYIPVKVKDKNGTLTTAELPNPAVQTIKPETDQIFSEIYV